MKEFKIFTLIERNGELVNVSEEIQEKLFSLGYNWARGGEKISHTRCPFLYTNKDGNILYDQSTKIENFIKDKRSLLDYNSLMNIESVITHNLKPYQKVLVRCRNEDKWIPEMFSHYSDSIRKYRTVGGCYWKYCIPYDNNEHLAETNKSPCDE